MNKSFDSLNYDQKSHTFILSKQCWAKNILAVFLFIMLTFQSESTFDMSQEGNIQKTNRVKVVNFENLREQRKQAKINESMLKDSVYETMFAGSIKRLGNDKNKKDFFHFLLKQNVKYTNFIENTGLVEDIFEIKKIIDKIDNLIPKEIKKKLAAYSFARRRGIKCFDIKDINKETIININALQFDLTRNSENFVKKCDQVIKNYQSNKSIFDEEEFKEFLEKGIFEKKVDILKIDNKFYIKLYNMIYEHVISQFVKQYNENFLKMLQDLRENIYSIANYTSTGCLVFFKRAPIQMWANKIEKALKIFKFPFNHHDVLGLQETNRSFISTKNICGCYIEKLKNDYLEEELKDAQEVSKELRNDDVITNFDSTDYLILNIIKKNLLQFIV